MLAGLGLEDFIPVPADHDGGGGLRAQHYQLKAVLHEPDARHDDVRGGRRSMRLSSKLVVRASRTRRGEELAQGIHHHRFIVDHQDSGGHETGFNRNIRCSCPVAEIQPMPVDAWASAAVRPDYYSAGMRSQLKGPKALIPPARSCQA